MNEHPSPFGTAVLRTLLLCAVLVMVFPVSTGAVSSAVVWGRVDRDVTTERVARVSVDRLRRLTERGIRGLHGDMPWSVSDRVRPVYRAAVIIHEGRKATDVPSAEKSPGMAAAIVREGKRLLELAYACLDLLIDDARASEL